MKKFYILSVLTLFAVSVFAQKEVGTMTKMSAPDFSAKPVTDTLIPGNMASATNFVIYGSQTGGYLFGSNAYGDVAKGEVFVVLVPYNIEGAIYWFGGKTEVSGAGTVKMVVWNMDGTGATLAGTAAGPGTELGSITAGISTIDTSSSLASAYVCNFTTPINVSADYCIGFDVTNCYPDTIGLVTTEDGQGGGMELAWEKWGDGTGWYTLQAAGWGSGTFDVDAVILPMVDMNAGGVADGQFINGLKMSTYPNPAADEVTLAYELQNDAQKVLVRILDNKGKVVEQMNLGSQTAGVYNIQLDLTNYTSGTYYYLVNAGADRMAKRMIITK